MDRIFEKDNIHEDVRKGFAFNAESTVANISIAPPPLQLKINDNDSAEEGKDSSKAFQLKENTSAGELPPNLQSGVESLSGFSLNDVNVHYNSSKPKQLSANAFAQGTDIHVGPGQEKHLPHEAWHVVQQKQGRVKATQEGTSSAGINDDPSLEQEADQMGAKALQMKSKGGKTKSIVPSQSSNSTKPVQFSSREEIVKIANKLGITKSIVAIAAHFNIEKNKAHQIVSLTTSVSEKIAALTEAGNKVKANAMETDDESRTGGGGGHAIARHGPGISDAALEKRLYSGMAPDNALSPAPGSSSKFKTYTAMVQTRQAAALSLKSEIVNAQSKVLKWKKAAIGDGKLKEIDDSMKARELTKQTAFDDADASHTKLMDDFKVDKSLGPTIPKSISSKSKAEDNLNTAKARAVTSGAELATPGKHLKRSWPGVSKLNLDINEAATEGALEDNVKMQDSYTIVVKHAEPIGEGFKSDDAISLTEVCKQAASNPAADDTTDLIPKSIGDIKNALVVLSVGGDINEFATYLSDAGNLKKARKKGSKGGKIYKNTQVAGDLYKTTTNLKVEGDKKLFASKLGAKDDKPINIVTANWPAFQHFPAAEDADEGPK